MVILGLKVGYEARALLDGLVSHHPEVALEVSSRGSVDLHYPTFSRPLLIDVCDSSPCVHTKSKDESMVQSWRGANT